MKEIKQFVITFFAGALCDYCLFASFTGFLAPYKWAMGYQFCFVMLLFFVIMASMFVVDHLKAESK